jgi:hypothetical protein
MREEMTFLVSFRKSATMLKFVHLEDLCGDRDALISQAIRIC